MKRILEMNKKIKKLTSVMAFTLASMCIINQHAKGCTEAYYLCGYQGDKAPGGYVLESQLHGGTYEWNTPRKMPCKYDWSDTHCYPINSMADLIQDQCQGAQVYHVDGNLNETGPFPVNMIFVQEGGNNGCRKYELESNPSLSPNNWSAWNPSVGSTDATPEKKTK
jgi:hypothetical protein